MLVELTEANYTPEVEDAKIPVIIDFYATWCGPCKITKPIFEELSAEYEGKVKFALLNIDQHRNLAIKFGITSIPAFTIIKDGEAQGKITGSKSHDELREFIDSYLV